jgi:xanthine phosphoribosyltransferase
MGDLRVSWEDFLANARLLSEMIRRKEMGWTSIVAVTRGGLIPAAILSRELNIRCIETVCLSSYHDQERGEIDVIKKPQGYGGKPLAIDDVADSGQTAQVVRKLMPKVKIAVIFAKPDSLAHIDYTATRCSQGTWPVFPWEYPRS